MPDSGKRGEAPVRQVTSRLVDGARAIRARWSSVPTPYAMPRRTDSAAVDGCRFQASRRTRPRRHPSGHHPSRWSRAPGTVGKPTPSRGNRGVGSAPSRSWASRREAPSERNGSSSAATVREVRPPARGRTPRESGAKVVSAHGGQPRVGAHHPHVRHGVIVASPRGAGQSF
jgi:hypothetical protein